MKKIEDILDRYGWAFKVLLVVFWLLWATQMFSPMKTMILGEIAYQNSRDPEKERQEYLEMTRLIDNKIEKARAEGTAYSATRYFEDLREIEEKGRFRGNPYPACKVILLMRLSMDNAEKGYNKEENVSKLSSSHRKWLERKISGREKAIEEVEWRTVQSWFISFYLRTALLALLFYLVRMVERGTILGTILAEKKKFVLAILGWPILFYKYPFNVVREIRVEAELRRIKDLFRSLTAKEVRLVREVANSPYYQEWISDFKTRNPGNFRRGLFLALVITIVLHVLSPSVAKASEGAKDLASSITKVESLQKDCQKLTNSNDEDNHQAKETILTSWPNPEEPLFVTVAWRVSEERLRIIFPDGIDHIPILLFVFTECFVMFFVNQTNKGKRNENSKKHICDHFITGMSYGGLCPVLDSSI